MGESKTPASSSKIPPGMIPHFQEYDPTQIDLQRDANLVIERTLEFGTWEEVRWLFQVYGRRKISAYVRYYGERSLSPVVFNYWRKLLGIRQWRKAPFPEIRKQLWNR